MSNSEIRKEIISFLKSKNIRPRISQVFHSNKEAEPLIVYLNFNWCVTDSGAGYLVTVDKKNYLVDIFFKKLLELNLEEVKK